MSEPRNWRWNMSDKNICMRCCCCRLCSGVGVSAGFDEDVELAVSERGCFSVVRSSLLADNFRSNAVGLGNCSDGGGTVDAGTWIDCTVVAAGGLVFPAIRLSTAAAGDPPPNDVIKLPTEADGAGTESLLSIPGSWSFATSCSTLDDTCDGVYDSSCVLAGPSTGELLFALMASLVGRAAASPLPCK